MRDRYEVSYYNGVRVVGVDGMRLVKLGEGKIIDVSMSYLERLSMGYDEIKGGVVKRLSDEECKKYNDMCGMSIV